MDRSRVVPYLLYHSFFELKPLQRRYCARYCRFCTRVVFIVLQQIDFTLMFHRNKIVGDMYYVQCKVWYSATNMAIATILLTFI